MATPHLLVERAGGIATVTLNRPEVHNAFDDSLVAELSALMMTLGNEPELRVIVLRGAGKSFSAGADVNWMRRMVDYGFDENVRDARALAAMFESIAGCPRPVIARVHGAALGGGAGLVAAADIAIAEEGAEFAFSEVRLGIVPAVISPYVLRRIGPGHAQRYFLTGERFDARRAAAIGLVSEVVAAGALDRAVAKLASELLRSAPGAIAAAKSVIDSVAAIGDRAAAADLTARRIAERRASREGQEGMRAFLEKRAPPWQRASDDERA